MKDKKGFFDELKSLRLGCDAIKDIVLVYDGVKPSTRLMLPQYSLKSLQEFLVRYGLCIIRSDYKVVTKKDRSKGGWGNKILRIVDANSDEGEPSYYIAKSDEIAKEAKTADFVDPDEFGQTLGYPICCQEFFKKYFPLANEKQCDFVLYTLKETKEDYPYDLYNNNASRYFGYSLLSHFPCSFNCKESSKLARSYYKVFERYSPSWANNFIYCQQSAIIYTEYGGIFLIKNFELNGDILRYGKSSRLYSTITNKNLELLSRGNNILIKSKNNFSIRQGDRLLKTFKGENVGLLVFG
ncbi:MAG: hypothetical protein JW778_01120 [Candidatus Altiarchaeota archaeon]|nr:hypothetical protein [Candidatus Altiarchaeota archaeon]